MNQLVSKHGWSGLNRLAETLKRIETDGE